MRQALGKILLIISNELMKTPEPAERKEAGNGREPVPSIPARLSKPFWIIFVALTAVILADAAIEAVKETEREFRASPGYLTTLTKAVTERASVHAAGALMTAILLSLAYSQTMSIAGGIMGTFRSSYRTGYYFGGIITHKILSIFFPNIEEMKRKTLAPYVKMANEHREEGRAEGKAEGIALGIAMERERQAKEREARNNGYY